MEITTMTSAAGSDRAFARAGKREWALRRPLLTDLVVAPTQGWTLPVAGPDYTGVRISHNSITFMDVRPFRDLGSRHRRPPR